MRLPTTGQLLTDPGRGRKVLIDDTNTRLLWSVSIACLGRGATTQAWLPPDWQPRALLRVVSVYEREWLAAQGVSCFADLPAIRAKGQASTPPSLEAVARVQL